MVKRLALATSMAVAIAVVLGAHRAGAIEDLAGSIGPRSDVTVHEWGTFTTVAGEDGQAVQWLPLGGPADLPCFVHAFENRFLYKIGLPELGPALTYETARNGMKGTVRMETPVLYFYAPKPTRVDVKVEFERGLFTEWYPAASVSQLPFYQNLLVSNRNTLASMAWLNVQIQGGNSPTSTSPFPVEPEPSHYYTARETDAAAVRVKDENEKFLFYRGIAGFPSPISTTIADNGAITIANRSNHEIPRLIVFTKQGTQLGYRIHGSALRAGKEVTIPRPSQNGSSPNGTFASLREDLERTLVAQGLYAREAHAMVETWRDSWFEDGTRVIYIVPTATVDAVLPLKINPMPAATVRVFVGRMDVITPADIRAVDTAFASNDRAALAKFGRLLGPIADRILAKSSSQEQRARIGVQLNDALTAHATRLSRCSSAGPTPTAND